MMGGNRSSLTLTMFQNGDSPIRLSAITAGGSQAVFFKVNTVGEESFLEDVKNLLEENFGGVKCFLDGLTLYSASFSQSVCFLLECFSLLNNFKSPHMEQKTTTRRGLPFRATVVAKRTDVSHSSSANAGDMSGAHGYDTSTFTSYYVTFQVESGDRMEFTVSGSDYGMLVEGDIGKLSFQGTRYLGFQRQSTSLFKLIAGI